LFSKKKLGQTATIKLLIKNGANLNLRNKDGINALMFAFGSQYQEIVTELEPLTQDFNKSELVIGIKLRSTLENENEVLAEENLQEENEEKDREEYEWEEKILESEKMEMEMQKSIQVLKTFPINPELIDKHNLFSEGEGEGEGEGEENDENELNIEDTQDDDYEGNYYDDSNISSNQDENEFQSEEYEKHNYAFPSPYLFSQNSYYPEYFYQEPYQYYPQSTQYQQYQPYQNYQDYQYQPNQTYQQHQQYQQYQQSYNPSKKKS